MFPNRGSGSYRSQPARPGFVTNNSNQSKRWHSDTSSPSPSPKRPRRYQSRSQSPSPSPTRVAQPPSPGASDSQPTSNTGQDQTESGVKSEPQSPSSSETEVKLESPPTPDPRAFLLSIPETSTQNEPEEQAGSYLGGHSEISPLFRAPTLRTKLVLRLRGHREDNYITFRRNPTATATMDRDSRSRRYDDGEVTRYGAGESYRPFNSNRSPRRARSPPRGRSPPIIDSDRYVPSRSPRRRSRSADRYRRDPSRDRRDARDARDLGGDSWRRRDRSRSLRRSPPRRPSPRRASPRRSSPRGRYSPRRDDRDRMRSPRRDFGARLYQPSPFANLSSTHNTFNTFNPVGSADPFNSYASDSDTTNPNFIPLINPRRRRSRSPYERDRARDRSPRRTPPQRASTYRTRSRSTDRRDDRYGSYSRRPSLPRDSAISSAIPSRDTSRRSSPHPPPLRRDDRSRPESPLPSRPMSQSSHGIPTRDRSPQGTPKEQQAPLRSPPRGPAALRAPPTGPRDNRTFGSQSGGVIGPPPRPSSIVSSGSGRPDISPSGAPSGPRGYVPSRGGGYSRGGRGATSWGSTIQSRNLPPSTGPVSATTTSASSTIPTGPRAGPTSLSVPSTPVNPSKPFNPPKGPAAENNRPSLAQQLLATLPPIIPGGKMDKEDLAISLGVLPELVDRTIALREEEEKLRAEKYVKEEKLRKNLAQWNRWEREATILDLRLELSERLMKKLAGEGSGGAF
ncbi:hypothetical protein F4806DRAFT_491245 [Annulohypoxylon nitens]|nr:hypothetical protein F4806DRAFT_491245 [Annulohypoxylon nitens]